MANLVDNMMNEMNLNNSPEVLNFDPSGQMHSMQQQQQPPQQMMDPQVQMGEVHYNPPMGGQAQMAAPTHQQPDEQQMMMDAPDLSNYGMEEEGSGVFDSVLEHLKGPLIVMILAFLMSLPQVSGSVRTFVARFTTNPLYVNVLMAVVMGLVYKAVRMVLE